jgi:hypothetical protein
MGMIEDLIELNKARAKEAQATAAGDGRSHPRARHKTPLLLRLAEKVKAFDAKHAARAALIEAEMERRKAWEEVARMRREARGGVYLGPKPTGTIGRDTIQVRVLAGMEPGRWYGERVLRGMAGTKLAIRGYMALFVDRVQNPAWTGIPEQPGVPKGVNAKMLAEMSARGEFPEPRWLYRLNAWGEDLRAAVLDDLTSIGRVDFLALPHANRAAWEQFRKGVRQQLNAKKERMGERWVPNKQTWTYPANLKPGGGLSWRNLPKGSKWDKPG